MEPPRGPVSQIVKHPLAAAAAAATTSHHHHKYYSHIPSAILELKPEVLHNSVGKPARKRSSRRTRRKWKRNTQLYLQETGKDCVKTNFKWFRIGSIRIMFAFFTYVCVLCRQPGDGPIASQRTPTNCL